MTISRGRIGRSVVLTTAHWRLRLSLGWHRFGAYRRGPDDLAFAGGPLLVSYLHWR